MTKPRASHLTILPPYYVPAQQDVMCCKGKKAKNHPGNLMLQAFIRQNLVAYKNAEGRTDRANIVTNIMEQIKGIGGLFVRHYKGCWADIGARNSREKIGASFRDHLHDQFKSSAKSKAQRRRSSLSVRTVSSQPELPLSQESSSGEARSASISDSESDHSDSPISDSETELSYSPDQIESRATTVSPRPDLSLSQESRSPRPDLSLSQESSTGRARSVSVSVSESDHSDSETERSDSSVSIEDESQLSEHIPQGILELPVTWNVLRDVDFELLPLESFAAAERGDARDFDDKMAELANLPLDAFLNMKFDDDTGRLEQ